MSLILALSLLAGGLPAAYAADAGTPTGSGRAQAVFQGQPAGQGDPGGAPGAPHLQLDVPLFYIISWKNLLNQKGWHL